MVALRAQLAHVAPGARTARSTVRPPHATGLARSSTTTDSLAKFSVFGYEERCVWGAKYELRKAVNRLTGPIKTLKNAHNTGFLRLARPGSVCRVVAFWGANQGRAVPALRLSLPNNPLVNSVCPGRTLAETTG